MTARREEGPIDGTPRLHRTPGGGPVAGVAAGIAAHLHVPPGVVRATFAVLLPVGGLGVLLYVVFWVVLPVADADRSYRPRERVLGLLPYLALALGVLVIRGLTGGGTGAATAAFGWLFALIALGAGLIWHQTGRLGRSRRFTGGAGGAPAAVPWLSAVLTENDGRAFAFRTAAGGGLIAVGAVGLVVLYTTLGGASVGVVLNGLVFALLAVLGVGVVLAPLVWRTFVELREEREARIREQERSEFAAMVHDQVLHTLALIQRGSTPGSTSHRLARAQERTLRNWLYKPTGSPTEKLAAALEEAGGEVEDAYGIAVEVVVVGDTDTDERVQALVAAAREALVNAARHARVPEVSLYGEVEPDQVNVFVRDRGVGFDPATVNGDRHGLRGSIIGRMERHGGEVRIVSSPGTGTEVRLRLPLTAKDGERHE